MLGSQDSFQSTKPCVDSTENAGRSRQTSMKTSESSAKLLRIVEVSDDEVIEISDDESNTKSEDFVGVPAELKASRDDKSTSYDCGKSKLAKKCKKIKFAIDRQNFVIAKLNREIECKSQQGFPQTCLQQLKNQLFSECRKLQAMVKCAMEQQNCKELWGAAKLSVNSSQLKLPSTPSSLSDVSAFSNIDFAEAILSDNNYLEEDRCHLQKEVLVREESIEDLQSKLEQMQCQLIKLCHDNKSMAEKLTKSADSGCKQEIKCQVMTITSNTTKLASNVKQLEAHLCELRQELCRLKKERQMTLDVKEAKENLSEQRVAFVGDDEKVATGARPKTCPKNVGETLTDLKLKHIQSQYLNLQMEFCRKERECREMAERMKKNFEQCSGDKEKSENEALKARADELVSEIDDYKVFIKELQEQVDSNREKFMKGKQNDFIEKVSRFSSNSN
jgi:hypothetical protein